VLDSSVSDLCSDQNIQTGGNAKKPGKALQRGLAIEVGFPQPFLDIALAQVDTHRDQRQTGEENYRKNQEYDDPNVGIIDVAPHMEGQNKEPRNPRSRDQCCAYHAQPMSSEQEPNGFLGR
jgi:ribosomal 50S subunit-recycling heat shock protein